MSTADKSSAESGRFAYEGLDRVIHERARLGVLTSLMGHSRGLVFGDLKDPNSRVTRPFILWVTRL